MDRNRVLLIVLLVVAFLGCNLITCCSGLLVGSVFGSARVRRLTGGFAMPDTDDWRPRQLAPTPTPQPQAVGIAALVTSVTEGGPADEAGLQPGDMILAIDGKRLTRNSDPRTLLSGLKPGDQITLTVRRGSRTQQVQLTLGQRPDGDAPYVGIEYRLMPLPQRQD